MTRPRQLGPTRYKIFCYPYRHPCPVLIPSEPSTRPRAMAMSSASNATVASVADEVVIDGRRVPFWLPHSFSGVVRLVIGVFSLHPIGRSFVRSSWARELQPDDRLTFLTSAAQLGTLAEREQTDEQAAHGDLFRFHGLTEAYARRGSYSSLPLKASARPLTTHHAPRTTHRHPPRTTHHYHTTHHLQGGRTPEESAELCNATAAVELLQTWKPRKASTSAGPGAGRGRGAGGAGRGR